MPNHPAVELWRSLQAREVVPHNLGIEHDRWTLRVDNSGSTPVYRFIVYWPLSLRQTAEAMVLLAGAGCPVQRPAWCEGLTVITAYKENK